MNYNLSRIINKIVGIFSSCKLNIINDVFCDRFFLAEKSSAATKVSQIALSQNWKHLSEKGLSLPCLSDVEFRCFSQNGEDGILLYIFSLLGTSNKRCVEICAGDGIQCNTTNLIINHGWRGLLVDGDAQLINTAKNFFHHHPDTFSFPPVILHSWITRDNVNDILVGNGFQGEIDLLSIDMDGVDYWIWEEIEAIIPRVVVVETQCIWSCEHYVSVPYSPNFSSPLIEGFGIYSGASLAAFAKLGNRKGYRLIGTNSLGFNAFFVRNDLALDIFPEVSVKECLNKPFVEWATAKFLPMVSHREWVEV